MTEITVAIPALNSATSIKSCLDRLTQQKIPNLPVLVYDEGSIDGTTGLVSELVGRGYYKVKQNLSYSTLQLMLFQGGREGNKSAYQNALIGRQKLARIATTTYIFFLDADVMLPPNCLATLLKDFKKQKNCAYMGVRYEPDAGHVMFGATIWKRDTFLKLGEWDGTHGCDCNFAKLEMEKLGLTAEHHPDLMGYHFKLT